MSSSATDAGCVSYVTKYVTDLARSSLLPTRVHDLLITIMIPERAHSILRRALQEHLDHASVLSQLLTVFFHERLQPADPDYVSESACRELLRKRSDVHSLLQSAIREQDCQRLWDCGACMKLDTWCQN